MGPGPERSISYPKASIPFLGTPTVLVPQFQPYALALSSWPSPMPPFCHRDMLSLPYLDWRADHVFDGSMAAP